MPSYPRSLTRALVASTTVGTVLAAGVLTTAAPAAATVSAGAPTAVSASARAYDVTMSAKARSSKSYRSAVSLRAFVSSAHARKIVRRESGGNCRVVNWRGPWRGKWQMTDQLWRSYGGKRYASHPERASCAQQDVVAYRAWRAAGWRPWGG